MAQKFKIVRNPRQLDISYYVWSLKRRWLYLNFQVFCWQMSKSMINPVLNAIKMIFNYLPNNLDRAQSAVVDLNEKKRYIKNSFKIHFWDANGTSGGAKKFNLP